MADPGNTTLILSDHTRITFLGLQKVVPADTRTLRTGISPSDAAALEEIDHIIERLDTEIPQVLAHDLDDATLSDEIDRIIARLDAEIPARKREMDELLSRLRTTLIRAA